MVQSAGILDAELAVPLPYPTSHTAAAGPLFTIQALTPIFLTPIFLYSSSDPNLPLTPIFLTPIFPIDWRILRWKNGESGVYEITYENNDCPFITVDDVEYYYDGSVSYRYAVYRNYN